MAEFYEFVLKEKPNGGDVHMSFDNCQLAIYNQGNVNVVKDKNMSLMYIVEDVDVEFKRLKESNFNITFKSEPTVKPWSVKSFMFKDPDGNEISFLTPIKK